MSDNNGAMFSQSVFGYNREDVNEYIRKMDQVHSGAISVIYAAKREVEEQLKASQTREKELKAILDQERTSKSEELRKLGDEYEEKIADYIAREESLKELLSKSESRVASYLKLADSASSRAETAEAEVSVLSAGLDALTADMHKLEVELENKNAEIKRLSSLENVARLAAMQRERKSKDDRKRYLFFKRPVFKWIKK